MPKMRAKMVIESLTKNHESETLYMRAVHKPEGYGDDGADENNTYAKFLPAATLTINIANPALLGKFNKGEEYYLDFSKVD